MPSFLRYLDKLYSLSSILVHILLSFVFISFLSYFQHLILDLGCSGHFRIRSLPFLIPCLLRSLKKVSQKRLYLFHLVPLPLCLYQLQMHLILLRDASTLKYRSHIIPFSPSESVISRGRFDCLIWTSSRYNFADGFFFVMFLSIEKLQQ